MPVKSCQSAGKPGYKWGDKGFCYVYNLGSEESRKEAKRKAIKQGFAIGEIKQDSLFPNKTLKTNRTRIPSWKYPKSIELQYMVYLSRLVNSWQAVTENLIIPNLERFVAEANIRKPLNIIRVDDWAEDLRQLINTFRISLNTSDISKRTNTSVQEIFSKTNDLNLKEFHKVTNAAFGIPLLQVEPWMQGTMSSFINNNVNLIVNTRDSVISQIENIVNQGINQGLRHETIKKQILEGTNLQSGVFKKVKTRARLIARDQVSKLNGQLTQLRQNEIGVSQYYWNTSVDERVRPSHAAMEGKLCRWDDPTVYSSDGGKTWQSRSSLGAVELHPGQDYQCRCWAEPDFKTIDLESPSL